MNDKQTPCHFMTLFNLGSLVNLPITTSETMRDYYSQTWYIRVAFPVVHCFKQKLELVSNIL